MAAVLCGRWCIGRSWVVVLAGEGDVAADAEGVHGFDVSDGLIGFDLDR